MRRSIFIRTLLFFFIVSCTTSISNAQKKTETASKKKEENNIENIMAPLTASATSNLNTAFEKYLKILIKQYGLEHAEVTRHIKEQAQLYYNLGLLDQSEKILKKHISKFKKELGPKHIKTRRLQIALAEIHMYEREKKRKLAREKARKAREEAEKKKLAEARRKKARKLKKSGNNQPNIPAQSDELLLQKLQSR